MPVSPGRWLSNSVNASRPPAEAPTPTTMGSEPRLSLSSAVSRTAGAREAAFTAAREAFPREAVGRPGPGEAGFREECTPAPGRRLPVFFATRHPHLTRPANGRHQRNARADNLAR